MKTAFTALLIFLFITAVVMGLGTVLVVGFGVLLARWLPISIFQASILAIGSTITFVVLVFISATLMNPKHVHELDNELYDDDDDDFDSGFTDTLHSFQKPDLSKVGRNDYCPCGSGKKFKNCCGITDVK